MELAIYSLLIVSISYLIGSIPTGVWISKTFFGFDIRTKGSGNIGSTNTFRVLGTKWGIIVQLVDIIKGILPVIIAGQIYYYNISLQENFSLTICEFIAGISAVLGHIFPVFASFKGGKGINTTVGILIAISPIEVGIAALAFALVFFSSGYVSLGSIIASVFLPFTLYIRHALFNSNIIDFYTKLFVFIGIFLLILFTHRTNISRLQNGSENRFDKFVLIKFPKKSK